MQKFLVLQSLWGLQKLRGVPVERSLEDNVAMLKAAGFDGFSSMWDTDEAASRSSALAKAEGLIIEGVLLPTSVEAVIPLLERGTKHGVHHLNLQLNMRPRTLSEALDILHRLRALTDQVSFPVYVETHRGRLTNDLHFTLDVLDAMPDLRLLGDISHYIVGREIELPISDEIQAQITTVLDHAWAFHGRVAGSEQIQLPISFAHNKPWVDQFARWWSQGFESWRKRAGADDELTFVCELGPQPYAMVGADGQDLTDRWEESKAMQAMVRGLWENSETLV